MNEMFLEAMENTASNCEKISERLFWLKNDIQKYPEKKFDLDIYSLVRSAEINTLQLRNLAARAMPCEREKLGGVLADAHDIQICQTPDTLVIRMPGILPGRNTKDNTRFVTRPLASAVAQFQRSHPCPRFRTCAICIVHIYDESMGLWRLRDYDNIETKRYLDVLEAAFLTTDSGLFCSVYQTTKTGLRDRTEFHIMRPEMLPLWLEKQGKKDTETSRKTGVQKGI